jgi:hypothetical protein
MIEIEDVVDFAGDDELLRLATALSTRCHEMGRIYIIAVADDKGRMCALYDVEFPGKIADCVCGASL